jgi:hypothetical protein
LGWGEAGFYQVSSLFSSLLPGTLSFILSFSSYCYAFSFQPHPLVFLFIVFFDFSIFSCTIDDEHELVTGYKRFHSALPVLGNSLKQLVFSRKFTLQYESMENVIIEISHVTKSYQKYIDLFACK